MVSYDRAGERGSVFPFVVVTVALGAAVLLLLAGLTERAVRRAEAQTAADIAALAGLYEGEAGANELAAANGARLVFYAEGDSIVQVVVSVDGVRAEAYADFEWDFVPIVRSG